MATSTIQVMKNPYPTQTATLDEVKSFILGKANAMATRGAMLISFQLVANVEYFHIWGIYEGWLYKSDNLHFTALVSSFHGDKVSIGYSEGNWVLNN